MTTSQLEKELLNYTKGLPQEALKEIIDFVQFISQRTSKKYSHNLPKKATSLSVSQTSHIEAEFKNYKQLYPSE